MKSLEEIDIRLNEVKQEPLTLRTSTIIDYLQMCKIRYNEPDWINHLLIKYSYKTKEYDAIVDTLRWVLEYEEEK